MKLTYNISKSFYFQFLPAMLLGVLTIILLFTGSIPLYYLWYTFAMWMLVCGLGIAVGYHRIFSHKTHNLPKWKENIILFFATFAGQGSSIFWAALHRGYHHPFSDSEKDLHSPKVYGKLNAFIGWYFKITEKNSPVKIKYAFDLLRKPNHIFFHKNNLLILWGVPVIVSFFDWRLALTGFSLVTFIGCLQDNIVNVYGHCNSLFGYRNFETNDRSHNNLILGYISWGQGWHNNHHYRPSSFDFGKSISGKWWEIDFSYLFYPFIGKAKSYD